MLRRISKLAILGILLALIGSLVAVACAGEEEEPTPTPRAPAPAATAAPAPTAAPAATAVPAPTAAPVATVPGAVTPTPAPVVPTPAIMPGEEPVYGGILTRAEGRGLTSFDVNRQTCICVLNSMNSVWSQVLYTDPQTFEVKPDLATGWDVSADGLTYTFHLRDDAFFHDGTPVTAEDVEYTVYRWMERPNGIPAARNAGSRFMVDSWKAVDPHTFQVTLKSPNVGFLATFGNAYGQVVPKRIWKKVDEEEEGVFSIDHWVGSGPFVAKEWRKDEFFLVERNPNYYRKDAEGRQLPYLDGIRIFRMDAVDTQQAAIRTKRIMMSSLFPGWTKTEADVIAEAMGDEVVADQSTSPAIFYFLQFNITKPPWDDVRMRKAVHLAIDRQKMIDLVTQGAGEISPWYHWAWDWIVPIEELKTWEGFRADKTADIAEAKRLVDEVTGGKGYTANLMCRSIDVYCDEAQTIVDDLKNIGIDVVLESFEANPGIQKWRRGDYELIGGQRIALEYDDPEAYNTAFFLKGGGWNIPGWENEEFNRLYEQEKAIADKTERGKILRQMVEILRRELPDAPLIEPAQYVVWLSNLKGWQINQTAQPWTPMWDVWIAK